MSTDQPTAPEGDEPHEPTQEEMVAAEMLRRLIVTPVRDVVMQTMATFTDMAAIRLGLGPRGDTDLNLEQAGLAIEALRALVGVADTAIGAAAARPFKEPLAQLQMAYTDAVENPRPAAGANGAAEGESPAAEGGIWTPGSDAQGGGGIWTPGDKP